VVILRIVLEDLWLLFVLKVPYEVVDLEVLPPFLAVDEPEEN